MILGVLKHFNGILVSNPITDLLVFLKTPEKTPGNYTVLGVKYPIK